MFNPNAAVAVAIPLALLAVVFAPGMAQALRRRRRMASMFAAPTARQQGVGFRRPAPTSAGRGVFCSPALGAPAGSFSAPARPPRADVAELPARPVNGRRDGLANPSMQGDAR